MSRVESQKQECFMILLALDPELSTKLGLNNRRAFQIIQVQDERHPLGYRRGLYIFVL